MGTAALLRRPPSPPQRLRWRAGRIRANRSRLLTVLRPCTHLDATSQLCDDFHGGHENINPCLERTHRGPCLKSVSTYLHQPPATVTERTPMFVNRLTRMIASGAVILGVGTIASLPATAAAHRSHHHPHHPSHHASGVIPQHNGGDRDADNNGGPSDGDGNV